MSRSKTLWAVLIFLAGSILMAACKPAQGLSLASPQVTATHELSATSLPPTITQTKTPTSTPTETPLPDTPTPTLTPTPKMVFNEAGEIDAPILLYHHVEGENFTSRYTVSIPDFKEQMQVLKHMGYTPISMSQFLDALLDGAMLPEKPIVITFDDGHESVYQNAFPIMNDLDFVGVFYIVANRLGGVEDFVDVPELKEMINAGWEIGSHSYTHADLTKDHQSVPREIGESKSRLEKALSTQVDTFAYPFGTIDPFLAEKVYDYGYRAGMGLGTRKVHTWNNVYYLERIEIYGNYSLEEFKTRISSD